MGKRIATALAAAWFVLGGCTTQCGRSQPAGPGQRFPWVGNKLGVVDSVPAPWLPLKAESQAVVYWGGRIEYGDALLPSQITSQGEELLARPVALELRVGGKPLELRADGPPKVGPKSDASVTVKTAGSSRELSVECSQVIEFDGMIRIDAVVKAQKAARIDSLSLQIPLRTDVASYYRRFYTYDFDKQKVDRADFMASAGSARQGWQTSFTPYVWLGTPEVGLEWFMESDEAWQPWGRPNALALRPGARETVLEARMISQPVTLRAGQSWSATFGLSPTPNRPPVANWRTYRWGGRIGQGAPEVDTKNHTVFAIFWIGEPGGLALERPGFPWPLDGAAYQAARAKLRQEAILYLPYGSLYKMDTNIPEWSAYGNDWSGGRSLSPWRSRAGGSRPSSTCVSAQSFRDFVVWTYTEAARVHDIDGLYFDFGAPGLNCVNPNHAHGAVVEKGIYHTSLFALRDLYRRLYVATEEVQPGFLIVIHGMLPSMCSSFVDAVVTGEGTQEVFNTSDLPLATANKQLRGRKWYVPDYVKNWPLEWVLAHLGRDVGTFPVLLPELTKHNNEYYKAHPDELEAYTRGMLALAALADVQTIWQTLADIRTLRQYSIAKAKFGPFTDDVAFHPFWSHEVTVEPQAPQVYPTLYTRSDRALLIISNLNPAAAEVTVDPGLSRMGVTPREHRAIDAMTGAALPLDGQGKVRVSIPGKDFVMVLLT